MNTQIEIIEESISNMHVDNKLIHFKKIFINENSPLYHLIATTTINNTERKCGEIIYHFPPNKDYTFITNIHVEAEFGQYGIGSMLLKCCENDTIQHKRKFVIGQYCPYGENAKNTEIFYKKNGYTQRMYDNGYYAIDKLLSPTKENISQN